MLGAGPLTIRQQVADIAEAIGEPVRFEVVDAGTYRADLLTQLPAPVVDRLVKGHGTIPQLPADLGVDAVPELLGRPALTFREWSQDHASDFR